MSGWGISISSAPVFYFLTAPVFIVIFSAQIGNLFIWQDFCPRCDPIGALFIVGLLLGLIIYIYLDLSPRSTYLVDFACYRPPNELKISKDEFIELAKKSGKFNGAAIEFQRRALKNSGIGDETYMPRVVFQPGHKITLKDGLSTEVVSYTWYSGNDMDMLLPNCLFRIGAAAMLLSSCRSDRWRSKYELKQLVRTHRGMDSRSFKSIQLREDAERNQGLIIEFQAVIVKHLSRSMHRSEVALCSQRRER
ncbi:hypothetical protein OIU84_011275 [Salix udensis]|uniref:FAE domain-containing protein n=1 Tax=Salix udensis TaxID=889485 RepID=A0AAD6JMU9_9ROSI|nr:hypothetical protein OIU84_011275 [Salix udensis]